MWSPLLFLSLPGTTARSLEQVDRATLQRCYERKLSLGFHERKIFMAVCCCVRAGHARQQTDAALAFEQFTAAVAALHCAPLTMLQLEVAVRILLVEDHPQLAESVAQALKGAGWTVDVLHDGVAADLALCSEEYALAILDIGLPRLDGFAVLSRLRDRGQTLPVLMLTARGEVKDRVHGLNLGADDYLAKPFELTELEARVKALLRRSVLGGEQLQRCGELVYDIGARRFSLKDEALSLTAREQAVLEAMIARPGRVMSKEQLASQVFGLDEDASPDAIEIYIHRLRKKLEGSAVRIVTFRGLGYLLEAVEA